jgi:hypothetical protein
MKGEARQIPRHWVYSYPARETEIDKHGWEVRFHSLILLQNHRANFCRKHIFMLECISEDLTVQQFLGDNDRTPFITRATSPKPTSMDTSVSGFLAKSDGRKIQFERQITIDRDTIRN